MQHAILNDVPHLEQVKQIIGQKESMNTGSNRRRLFMTHSVLETLAYFRIGGAGAADEACFIAKAASVYTHLQSIKLRVK